MSVRFTLSPQATVKLDKGDVKNSVSTLSITQSRDVILERRETHKEGSTFWLYGRGHSPNCDTGMQNLNREFTGKRKQIGAQDS